MIDIMSSCFGRGVYIEGSKGGRLCVVLGATEDRRRGILEGVFGWRDKVVNGSTFWAVLGLVMFTRSRVC